MRTKIIPWAVSFIILCLVLYLADLQIIQGSKFRDLSNKNCIRLLPQAGARGKILDRRGEIIVEDNLSYDVVILAQDALEINRILLDLARILEAPFEDLKKAFTSGYIGPSLPVAVAKNIGIKKAMAVEELKMDLPGVIIQSRPLRYYPYAQLASHVLGYISEIDRWRLTELADYGYKTKDDVGFAGIEEEYDYYLRQEEGGLSMEVDHRGRFRRVLGFRSPENGKDLQLTLDLKIQKIAEDVLGQRKGSIIIIDPEEGGIFALANRPSFNPEIFIKKNNAAINSLFNDTDAPLLNRAAAGAYPAGSVFKVVVAAAALEAGKIKPSTSFYCPGSLRIGNRSFACWNTHHQEDLSAAIAHSCDVFFYHTGLLLGAKNIHDYALKFGLGRPTNIDLPYEASGFVPDPLWKKIYRRQKWYDGDTANFAIGQGDLLVTPLQMARVMAVFANQGKLITLYLAKSINGRDIARLRKKPINLPIKESTINCIKDALRRTVSDPKGTANVLSGLPVAVAGKTGSVQVSKGAAHGWFAGFFPFKNPRFVICVFLEHGGSGAAACVVTRQIIERMVEEGLAGK